jgi:predicted nucleic acid-binding protein
VDTGAWIALANRDDGLHDEAAKHYAKLTADHATFITTSYVIAETATRLRYDISLELALAFRDTIRALEQKRRLHIVWVDRRLEALGWEVLARHADVELSLTDATAVAVARSRRIREVFGFDDDFRAVGLAVAPD